MDDMKIWEPKDISKTKMYDFMRFLEHRHTLKLPDYETLYQWSTQHLDAFWKGVSDFFEMSFDKAPRSILTYPNDACRMQDAIFFEGATFNFAQTLLERLQTEHPALICIDEQGKKEIVYAQELRTRVAMLAAGMKKMGVQPFDRVAGVVNNNAYAIVAMLATTALGAIWSSCSPDFGAEAIADRLGQIEPKLLFITDTYRYQGKFYPMQDKIEALKQRLSSLEKIVLCTSEPHSASSAVTWSAFLETEALTFRSFPFNHPLYILFSSGTTGQPKCIVHSAGGTRLQHLKELGLHSDIGPKDTLLFYTTCGWMMWNWMVSALALGTTLVLYDGAPNHPEITRLLDVVENEGVTVFGTSAKFLASLEHANVSYENKNHFQKLRTILSTGSPLLPTQYDYVQKKLGTHLQLSSISGGTDIIGCFALGNPISPVYRGELQCLGLGMAVEVYDTEGKSVTGVVGELVCTTPFPSMPLGFYHDPGQLKYKKTYFSQFPNVWTHGDFAEITTHHGLIIHGRSDATLNPGGVRIGTAEIYRQLEHIPEIQDSVVIGQEWHHDTRIILFVTLKTGVVLDEALKTKIRQILRQNASPRHVPAKIIAVPDIPKTINGKTVEMAVRQAVHGQEVSQFTSLANPEALSYFKNRQELSVD